MQKAIFYGASDDLIEVTGVKGGDEFNAYGSKDGIHAKFNLGGKMRIYAIYDGCWMFAIGQVDEDILLPDWPITITQSREVPYSTQLEIVVPDDVKLFREG